MPRPVPSSPSRATATSGPSVPDHRHRCYAETASGTASPCPPGGVLPLERLPGLPDVPGLGPPGGRPFPRRGPTDALGMGGDGRGGRGRGRRWRGVTDCGGDGPTDETGARDVTSDPAEAVAAAAVVAAGHDDADPGDAPYDDADVDDPDGETGRSNRPRGPTSRSTGTRHVTGRRRRHGSPRARPADRAPMPSRRRSSVNAPSREPGWPAAPRISSPAARLRPVGPTRTPMRGRLRRSPGLLPPERPARLPGRRSTGAGCGRPHRLPGRAAQPDPAAATIVRPASRRPARPGLGAAAPPGGLPGDQGPRRHAPGAADRGHGGRHRPARDRALLLARDPEHRRKRRPRRRRARHRRPRRGVGRPDRAARPHAEGLHDQEGRHAAEGGPGERTDARGAAGGEPDDQEPEQGVRGPADHHPAAERVRRAGGASAAPSKKPELAPRPSRGTAPDASGARG